MRLRDFILHNFWWKLLSLLLAILMWLTIQKALKRDLNLEQTLIVNADTRRFPSVPLTMMTATPNLYHYRADPATVEVEISGSVDDLAKLQERQVHAFVDVSDAGEEKQFRRVIQAQVPGNLKVEHLNPENANVERVTLPNSK